MKVYNESKTELLETYDLELGYLVPDQLFVAHHEAVEAFEGEYHHECVYEGKTERANIYELVWDKPPIKAQDAWDEYEDILVYRLFTAEQLAEIKRTKRERLLDAFDKYKTNISYGIKQETEGQKAEIITWYRGLLDLVDSAFENIPNAIKYYLKENEYDGFN